MKIMFLSNIPSPYRLEFFNELGKIVNLKVVFEAERNYDLNEKWYMDSLDNLDNFECVFLKRGAIEEKRINWKILKYLNRKNQDLIVVTNYAYFTELIALLYIKMKRIPYCMEVDGGIIRNENIILKIFKRFLIRGAKAYISPSKSTDEFLIYYGADKEKIYRYPFTSLKKEDLLLEVLSKNEKDIIRKKLNIKEEKVILSVGRFIYSKGYDILLRACMNIDKNIGVYIVGGEATQEYIRLKKELKLYNVHFIGFKTKEELKEYYKAADLFVLPTREDVWGLVINEAMAHGLPVITTNKCVAGLELVKDEENGFIVNVQDEEALSEKINIIIDDTALMKNMQEASLEKIKKYTIEKMAKRNYEILLMNSNIK